MYDATRMTMYDKQYSFVADKSHGDVITYTRTEKELRNNMSDCASNQNDNVLLSEITFEKYLEFCYKYK